MNKYIALSFYIFLFYACGFQDVHKDIPSNEKPIFKNGAIIYFKSNNNSIDSFQINNYVNDFRVSDKRYYYEYIRYNYDSINPKSNSNRNIYERESDFIMLRFKDFGIKCNPADYTTKTVTINGKEYKNVFEFDNPKTFPEPTITKLFYNHNYCILKYQTKDGETWELDKIVNL